MKLYRIADNKIPTFREIREKEDPGGTNHDLRLICVKCGGSQTCRCTKPKREFKGVCPYCTGELERFNFDFQDMKIYKTTQNKELNDFFQNIKAIRDDLNIQYQKAEEAIALDKKINADPYANVGKMKTLIDVDRILSKHLSEYGWVARQ